MSFSRCLQLGQGLPVQQPCKPLPPVTGSTGVKAVRAFVHRSMQHCNSFRSTHSQFSALKVIPSRTSTWRRSAVVAAAAQLDPDNASILVAGGGGIALEITRKLKDMGAWVWMLQRSESRRKEIEGMMAIVTKGDALNPADVQSAFDQIEEVDAVVSTIGGTPADPSADSQGNINLIEAAIKKGVKRFVLVTSIGTGDSKDAPPPGVYDVLKPVLLQKEKAEAKLKESSGSMEFVIIRPGGLKSAPATGTGVLTEDTTVCGAIHRDDVAQLVVKALFSEKARNKVLSCVDKQQLFGDPKFDVFDL